MHVRGLDQRALKKVYRRKAQATHPDRAHLQPVPSRDPDAEFRAVVAAYELLRLVQQGDVDVAAMATRAQPASRPRPAQPTSTSARQRDERATRAADRAKRADHAAGDGSRSEGRQQRREHRAEQPFSAGSAYQRWRGRFEETARPSEEWATRWREAAGRSRSSPDRDRHSEVPLPDRTLQIGQFLYYSGAVSWRQLIDALVWQRRQRPLIGQLALAWGMLTREQIAEVLQRRRDRGDFNTPFAEFAMQCGFLTATQHRALCGRAQLLQQRLGRYFTEQGILSEAQLNEHLRAMRLHNWRVRRRAQING